MLIWQRGDRHFFDIKAEYFLGKLSLIVLLFHIRCVRKGDW